MKDVTIQALLALRKRIDLIINEGCLIGSQMQNIESIVDNGSDTYTVHMWNAHDEFPTSHRNLTAVAALSLVGQFIAPEAAAYLVEGKDGD